MGMGDKTKESIISKYLKTGTIPIHKKRGGAITVIYDKSTLIPFLVDLVEKECTITLENMRAKLIDRIPSVPTISSWLDELYTVKKPLISPEKRNCTEVKEERHDFAKWYLELSGRDKKRLVAIDEHLKDLWMRPTRGRSKKGTNAYAKTTTSKGYGVMATIAISSFVGKLERLKEMIFLKK
eukprot:TRINITY_DN1897_c0_g1_i2.p1 TRINITY_DN1897_c0_g1~~TRINITY_DN1897_c0_g1_i2.p1  ORF type:complete len:182 (-),score=40.19 TRINITY_DN1897_c0_g1_i2:299-844(-)